VYCITSSLYVDTEMCFLLVVCLKKKKTLRKVFKESKKYIKILNRITVNQIESF